MERTLVLLKPDIVLRGIVGEILTRFEKIGLKIAAIKMIKASTETLQRHYYKDENWMKEKGQRIIDKNSDLKDKDPIEVGRGIVESLVRDMQHSPIIAIVLEGHNAVATVKRLAGPTNIDDAAPGTIRGDFSHDTFDLANQLGRPNLTVIHVTDPADGKEQPQKEIDFWFSPDEIHEYKKPEEDIHYRKQN